MTSVQFFVQIAVKLKTVRKVPKSVFFENRTAEAEFLVFKF